MFKTKCLFPRYKAGLFSLLIENLHIRIHKNISRVNDQLALRLHLVIFVTNHIHIITSDREDKSSTVSICQCAIEMI